MLETFGLLHLVSLDSLNLISFYIIAIAFFYEYLNLY